MCGVGLLGMRKALMAQCETRHVERRQCLECVGVGVYAGAERERKDVSLCV